MVLKRVLEKLGSRRPVLEQPDTPPLSFERVEHTINETLLDLFEQNRSELLTNPPLYLVPAVWGEGTKGFTELDGIQKDMHRALTPVIKELMERFSQSEVDSNGFSATEYLLRALVLYKMAYMVQYYLNYKGYCVEGGMLRDRDPLLERMEPLGRA